MMKSPRLAAKTQVPEVPTHNARGAQAAALFYKAVRPFFCGKPLITTYQTKTCLRVTIFFYQPLAAQTTYNDMRTKRAEEKVIRRAETEGRGTGESEEEAP
jgi:hypothetical protein